MLVSYLMAHKARSIIIDDGWWEIVQQLLRVQLLVKSMTGEEIARELVHVLSVEYGISVNQSNA